MNALCNITFLLRIRRKSHHRTISSLQKRLLGHAINVIHILNSHRSWREKWDYFNSKKKKIRSGKVGCYWNEAIHRNATAIKIHLLLGLRGSFRFELWWFMVDTKVSDIFLIAAILYHIVAIINPVLSIG